MVGAVGGQGGYVFILAVLVLVSARIGGQDIFTVHN